MTLLFFLKPIAHQGHTPPIVRRIKRRKKKYVKQLAETLELEPGEVETYVDEALNAQEEDLPTMLERVGAMVKKSLEAKRKKLNMMIASIWDWL